jgi:hypothetical protein
MRVLLGVALLVAGSTAVAERAPQDRPLQADPVVRLLADLEAALLSGRADDFRALSAAAVSSDSLAVFQRAITPGPVTTASIRERSRLPQDGGYEVVADALIGHGRNGRLATWIIKTERPAGATGGFALGALAEPASLGGLLRLTLDSTRQFAVHGLRFEAPDFVVTMGSGDAFVAEDDGGVTALVLSGRGQVTFTPSDSAEQGQLQVLAGRPALSADIESAFIRLNSEEFAARVSSQSLSPAKVDPSDLTRARAIFDDRTRRAYNLDLRDLSSDRWSITPSAGSALVDFRTSRWNWLTYLRTPGEAEDIVLFDRARNRNLSSYTSAERLKTRGRYYSEDANLPYDVERYNLDVTFSPDRRFISGRSRVRLRVVAGAIGAVTLKLAESLVVSAVSSPQLERLLALRVVGQNHVIVHLPTHLARGTTFDVDLVYSGRLDPEEIDRDTVAPTLAETDAPTALSIDPEPRLLYSSQVYWYPQSLVTDYATAVLRLRVPSEYQIVASGTVIGSSVTPASEEEGTRGSARIMRTVEFAATRPVRYLACVISRFGPIGQLRAAVPAVAPAPADAGTRKPGDAAAGVNIEVVSTPRMTSRNRALPARVADILRVFAERMGEAPYPDLTVAGIEDNLPGGHSPAFFSIWLQPLPSTPYTWINDPLALEGMAPSIFLAHEVAHQWWGQAVGWKNYHEQWLSEGLSQYFAAMYAGVERGPDTMRQVLAFMRQSAMEHSSQGPIWLGYRIGHIRRDPKAFRAIVYNKSAVVLHMLRTLIGDDAFFAGLRRFYRTHRFSKAGTDDLQAAFEAETPARLGNFFERWVIGATLPRLRVSAEIDDGGAAAIVRVEQLGEVFDLPLTVTVQYVDGQSEAVMIPVSAAKVQHRIALKGRVRRIETRDELVLATYVK